MMLTIYEFKKVPVSLAENFSKEELCDGIKITTDPLLTQDLCRMSTDYHDPLVCLEGPDVVTNGGVGNRLIFRKYILPEGVVWCIESISLRGIPASEEDYNRVIRCLSHKGGDVLHHLSYRMDGSETSYLPRLSGTLERKGCDFREKYVLECVESELKKYFETLTEVCSHRSVFPNSFEFGKLEKIIFDKTGGVMSTPFCYAPGGDCGPAAVFENVLITWELDEEKSRAHNFQIFHKNFDNVPQGILRGPVDKYEGDFPGKSEGLGFLSFIFRNKS